MSHRIPISIALWETFNIISTLSASFVTYHVGVGAMSIPPQDTDLQIWISMAISSYIRTKPSRSDQFHLNISSSQHENCYSRIIHCIDSCFHCKVLHNSKLWQLSKNHCSWHGKKQLATGTSLQNADYSTRMLRPCSRTTIRNSLLNSNPFVP